MTPGLSGARRVLTARPWVSGAVALVLIGGGATAYVLTAGSGSDTAAATTTTRLVQVATGTVRESVSATGTLTPADEENVSFGSAAEITSVRVTRGQHVTKGEALGTIATVTLTATLARARATLATSKATLADAQDSADTTAAQLAADKAAVTSARSAVSDAAAAVTAATLRSPITGTVAEVNVSVGEQSTGSGSSSSAGSTTGTTDTGSTGSGGGSAAGTGGGSTTGSTNGSTNGSTTSTGTTGSATASSSTGDFIVVGLKSWTISASVDDTEVGLISKGDQAQITTDNVTGTVFGTVSSVSVLSSSTSGSATYPVEIAVTGSPAGLHDGASATVAIVYKQATDVLTVASAAIHRSGTTSYVYVSKNGVKTKQTVRTGLASGGTTQVTSGLTSGQQVYVESIARTGGSTTTGTSNRTTNQGNYPGGGNFPGGGNAPGGNFPGGANGGTR